MLEDTVEERYFHAYKYKNCNCFKSKSCYVTIFVVLCVIMFASYHHSGSVCDLIMLGLRDDYLHSQQYSSCVHHTCFNVAPCVYEYPDMPPNQIRVYVYPELLFVDENRQYIAYRGNQRFRDLLNALNSSKYAVHDPSKACLFVASMDFEGSSYGSSSRLLDMALSFPWYY